MIKHCIMVLYSETMNEYIVKRDILNYEDAKEELEVLNQLSYEQDRMYFIAEQPNTD